MRIEPDHPAVAGRTGRGVAVAVIDSGVNPWHPHVRGVAGGFGIVPPTTTPEEGPAYQDHVGHGTAVTAAIRERAPDAELHAVKVFHETLETSVDALVSALDWAGAAGVRLVNLSLGTRNADHRPRLEEALARAVEAGVLVVSVRHTEEGRWLPGDLPGAVGVVADAELSRHTLLFEPGDSLTLRASPLPRSIPGVPPAYNVQGASFAVANATGGLACLLEGRSDLKSMADLTHWAADRLTPKG